MWHMPLISVACVTYKCGAYQLLVLNVSQALNLPLINMEHITQSVTFITYKCEANHLC